MKIIVPIYIIAFAFMLPFGPGDLTAWMIALGILGLIIRRAVYGLVRLTRPLRRAHLPRRTPVIEPDAVRAAREAQQIWRAATRR